MMFSMLGIAALQRRAARYPGDPGNYAIVVFPYLFYLFFNVSWGVGSWTYAAEIWPLRYRAKGNAISTASLWIGTYVVAQATPPIVAAIGWGLYVGYAVICVAAFVFVRYALGKSAFPTTVKSQQSANHGVVETRNRTLEEMAHLFGIEDALSKNSLPLVSEEVNRDDLDGFTSDEGE
jgi:xanthosine utilization system XapX-like protein